MEELTVPMMCSMFPLDTTTMESMARGVVQIDPLPILDPLTKKAVVRG